MLTRKKEEIPKLRDVLSESWPFGLASIFAFVYIQSDIIMLKYISGNSQAGYYNTSFVILTAILMLPSILFGKYLLPKYHRWANHDTKKFYNAYLKGNKLMVVSGLFVMAATFVLAKFLILNVFGEDYFPSIGLMKVLSLNLPISFLSYSIGATLVTKEHMKVKVLLMGIVALTNIVLNIILIPFYGAYGAAIATIISNLLLLVLYSYFARKRVFQLNLKGQQ
jgi:O-antigen/teichoic acid export membrane protein